MMEVRCFNDVVVTIAQHTTLILFSDGTFNRMDRRALETDEYRRIAAWAGYPEDIRGYNIDHDLVHCWLADELGHQWSEALHDPYPGPLCDAPQSIKDEEHLVNALQRILREMPDPDPFDHVAMLFGHQLEEKLNDLGRVLG